MPIDKLIFIFRLEMEKCLMFYSEFMIKFACFDFKL